MYSRPGPGAGGGQRVLSVDAQAEADAAVTMMADLAGIMPEEAPQQPELDIRHASARLMLEAMARAAGQHMLVQQEIGTHQPTCPAPGAAAHHAQAESALFAARRCYELQLLTQVSTRNLG